MVVCRNKSLNDGTAIAVRITTGISVQATSSSVLCVVLVGTGLAFALKRKITISSSTRTNNVIAVMR